MAATAGRAEVEAGTAAGIEVGPPASGERRASVGVLARAFLDDPVWVAIGPRLRIHRRLTNRASFAGILAASSRHGARITVAREGGRVVGATIAFEPGSWPVPDGAAVWELGWALLAGPLPMVRGLRDDRAMRAQHVDYPHMYLWFIGADPELHGRGVGRALMEELHRRSDQLGVPTYLETGTERNVGFYRARGYALLGEIAMPSGARMWRMERPAP